MCKTFSRKKRKMERKEEKKRTKEVGGKGSKKGINDREWEWEKKRSGKKRKKTGRLEPDFESK